MAKFSYVAVEAAGRRVEGTHSAVSLVVAEAELRSKGLHHIQLKDKKSFLQAEITPQRVKREEVMHLSRQLGAFVRAGLPLIEAVHILGTEAKNNSVRRMMADVEEGLRRGEKLSDCFSRHPKIFPEFYRGILRSAELTGRLDAVLDQLARYLERDIEARRKITSALIYPGVIAVMSVITVVILTGFVLPRFEVFFEGLDAELPWETRFLLETGRFVTRWWWALIASAAAFWAIVFAILQTNPGRRARDRFVLRLPVIGLTIRYSLVERFCRVLSSMAGAGVALPDALRVAKDSLRNRVYMQALDNVGEAMLHGEGLAGPLARTGVFPSTAARMIRVGEETGTLETQLEVTAKYYEGELDYRLKKLTALFEPAVILVMGCIVGFVAVALVRAMYGIFSQVNI